MQDDAFLTAAAFLIDNRDSATIVEYIATKYGAQLNPDKTLAQNAQALQDYLTEHLDDDENSRAEYGRRQITMEVRPDFDTPAYMGLWYSAASIPQFFDWGSAWKTATYTLEGDEVEVFNQSFNQDGTQRAKIYGSAKAIDHPATLRVSFPKGRRWFLRPNRVNYVVHATDYDTYAVVGSPNGSGLYILVRQRPISRALYNKLRNCAASLGYDVSRLAEDYGAIDG